MGWFGRAFAAAIAVGRGALGFIALILVAAALAASRNSGDPPTTEAIDPERRTDTHTLRVANGEVTGHLTVLDESGLPMATLTRWSNGSLAVVARCEGPGVAVWLNKSKRTAGMSVRGTSWQTHLRFRPDGTAEPPRVDSIRGATAPEEPRE